MTINAKNIIIKILNLFISSEKNKMKILNNMRGIKRKINIFQLALDMGSRKFLKLIIISGRTRSQLGQEVFALGSNNMKNNGFFVEFGATNGIDLSNTYLLEKKYGWSGILAEPAKLWHEELRRNRAVHLENNCVWRTSNEVLTFTEVTEGEYSTITNFKDVDEHSNVRSENVSYDVQTISLLDLLKKYNAPYVINFLSIDTEGSEFEILNSFDFNKYRFECIACEHNYTENREKIYNLLTSNGYKRVYERHSRFDDWYIYAG